MRISRALSEHIAEARRRTVVAAPKLKYLRFLVFPHGQGGNPPFCSAPLRKINSKKFSRCARNNGRIARKYPPKTRNHPQKRDITTKKSKNTTKKREKHPNKREKHPQNFFALTRERLVHRTKKIINFPAPFKGAQERGIAALVPSGHRSAGLEGRAGPTATRP